jgi:hypothetical protein
MSTSDVTTPPVSTRSRRATKNRNPIKQWFYTFPQTNLSKIDFRNSLIEVHSMKYFKIVQETHSDGNTHLHAVVQTTKPLPKSAILKKLKIIYPNDYKRIDVQPVRSIPQTLNYLSKEDKHPLESIQPFKDARNPHAAFNLRMVKKWGFPSVETFTAHMKEEKEKQCKLEKEYLARVFELENLCTEFHNTSFPQKPEVIYALQQRDSIERLQHNWGTIFCLEKMKYFIQYFEKTF